MPASTWTQPPTAGAGNVITSGVIFNTGVRDNLLAMAHCVYEKNTATDDVSNSTAVDLLNGEVTIAANAVSASGSLRLLFLGDYLNNSGAGSTLTLDIALGGTTIWKDTTGSVTTAAGRRPLYIDFSIGAHATNSQFLAGAIFFGAATAPTTGIGAFGGSPTITPIASNGLTALDMTTSKTLTLKATHSVNNALISCRCEYASVWVLP